MSGSTYMVIVKIGKIYGKMWLMTICGTGITE